MKINRKGFTLIELLTAIVIIALVVSLSVYGILKVRENSEGKANAVSLDSIKVSARVYSGEAPSDSWKDLKDEYTYDAFCVTVGELKSKGLLGGKGVLGSDVTLPKGIEENTYILVKRNKTTLAIIEENIDKENICNNNNIIAGEESINGPKIEGLNIYTDRIEVTFSDTKQDDNIEIVGHSCLYGTASGSLNKECNTTENKYKYIISGLKNKNSENQKIDYYFNIWSTTKKGSSASIEGEPIGRSLKDIQAPTISTTSGKKIKIVYDDTNIYAETAKHYFYSDKGLDVQLETITINGTKWYVVDGNSIEIAYPSNETQVTIKARTYDESNNYEENIKTYNKFTATFKTNTAEKLSSAEESCITEGNECNVKSPTITPKIGSYTIGFNQNPNAETSEWNENTEKRISSGVTYHAITKLYTYTISYNPNGGNGAPASQTKTYGIDLTLSNTIPQRTGYTFLGWGTSNTATSKSYDPGDKFNVDATTTLHAVWKENSYIVTYNCNGGSASGNGDISTIKVNYTQEFKIAPKTACERPGYTFIKWTSSQFSGDLTPGKTVSKLTANNNTAIGIKANWIKIPSSTSTTINADKFVCEDTNRLAVYFVTTCTGNACVYNKKNGLNNSYNFSLDTTGIPTWSISKTSYSDTVEGVGSNCSKQYLYVNTSVACRSGASTSGTTTEYSWSACTPVYAYRTTMKVDGDTNWYYSSTYGCYMHGDYLSTSEPSSCSSSGQVGLCGSCSSNTDCSVGTCSGTCTSGGRSYSCCVTSGSSQCN